MEIITGRTGQPHVYAADDAEIYKLFLGDGDFCLVTGNRLSATRSGTLANTIVVSDGSIIMQGRLAKIRPTSGADLMQFDVGTTGYTRTDLIVAEYNQTITESQIEQGGEVVTVRDIVESIELKVVKGTPVPYGAGGARTYTEPDLVTGNIDSGETHQMKLWEIRIDGMDFNSLVDHRVFLNTTPIQSALSLATQSVAQIQAQMAALQSDIYDYADNLREGISSGFRGCWKAVVNVSDSSSAISVTIPSNNVYEAGELIAISHYVYAESDVIEIYLEGLRLTSSEYSVTGTNNVLSVTLSSGTFTGQMEVVVFKLAEEQS